MFQWRAASLRAGIKVREKEHAEVMERSHDIQQQSTTLIFISKACKNTSTGKQLSIQYVKNRE